MTKIKNIIFDFDGVIENTYDFCYELEKKRDTNLTHKKFQSIYCGNYWDKIDKKHITNKNIKNYEQKYKYEIQKRKTHQEIKTTLQTLAQSYKLFIISSCSEENINFYLENNNLKTLFQKILGRETHYSKITKFKLLFQQYNTNSNSCIFITDTLGDILEANQINTKTIATTSGYHTQEILKKGNPYKIINNIKELNSIFFNNSSKTFPNFQQ